VAIYQLCPTEDAIGAWRASALIAMRATSVMAFAQPEAKA